MHYSSASSGDRESRRTGLLHALGGHVRAERQARGLSIRALAERAGMSERFLAQLESGDGNISVARLADVALALGTPVSELLAKSEAVVRGPGNTTARDRMVVLLGLRGAGKSTMGRALAKRLDVPFVELDSWVAREAGMDLATLFEIHGEAYFRRVERDVLRRLLDAPEPRVVAAGGSIVTDPETFALLREHTTLVWLKAKPEDHFRRVVEQGDERPMKDRANAMAELKALLRARKPLYAQAHVILDTSTLGAKRTLEELEGAVVRPSVRPAPRKVSPR
ncbi:MAG: shikimate kinase [Polyangiaceae bacterium]